MAQESSIGHYASHGNVFDKLRETLAGGNNHFAAAMAKLAESLPPDRLMALIVFGVIFPDDLAKVFGKELQTIKNAMAKREIPFTKWGNTTVLLVDSFRDWLREMETKPHGSR